MGEFSVEGSGALPPLMMYGFCSSNALYSVSISFTFFLVTPFDTRDSCYFKSNLNLLMYIKVLLIKNM